MECETPKSPPGDYNIASLIHIPASLIACETPKSPPGDYNVVETGPVSLDRHRPGVKHLNPRQGITTLLLRFLCGAPVLNGVKHLNPRQGITTPHPASFRESATPGVKHLNPRQGITTGLEGGVPSRPRHCLSVKHLNPRQGITTYLKKKERKYG